MEKVRVHVDDERGELFLDKTPHILQDRGLVAKTQMEFEKIIGPATKTIMIRASRESVIKTMVNSYGHLFTKYAHILSKKILMGYLAPLVSKRGWGIMEIMEFDKKNSFAKVRLYNSNNAIGYKDSLKPVCYVFSGVVEAVAEIVFNKKMSCRETKCIAMGDNYCEFEVHKKEGAKEKPDFSKYKRKKFSSENLREMKLKVNRRGELLYARRKSELYARDFLATMQMEFEKIIGPATRRILYNVYKKSVIENFGPIKRRLLGIFGKLPHKIFQKKILKQLVERGCGVYEERSGGGIKAKRTLIRIKNSFNAVDYKKTDHPVCYAFAGSVSATLSITHNQEIECRETKCIAKGDSYCEFETYPKNEKEHDQEVIV